MYICLLNSILNKIVCFYVCILKSIKLPLMKGKKMSYRKNRYRFCGAAVPEGKAFLENKELLWLPCLLLWIVPRAH